MRKVLEIIGSGSPGGGTSVVLSLCRGLVDRGIDVTIATHRDSYLVQEARRSGIGVWELDFSSRLSSLNLAFEIRRSIIGTGADLVHAHGARAALPLSLLPGIRTPLVYTVHGFHYPTKTTVMRYLGRQAERYCISRTSMPIFVSKSDQNRAVSDKLLSPTQSHKVIWNGADGAAPSAVMTSLAEFDIAFLGRLHFQKNPLIIPEILLALRPARPTMAIIGGGQLEAALRTRVTEAGLDDQVTFFGECSHAQGVAQLSRARIMLLPSLSEGLSVSIIEAMHAGIPTVASRVGGVPEQIEDGRTGYLVESGDVQGYARGLRHLLTDSAARQEMGARAQEMARRLFSVERYVEDHVAVYENLLHRNSVPADLAAVA